jgi:hypothetical protein
MNIFKYNRSLKTLIKDYKRQNTKGWKGVKTLISEEKTIFKLRLEYLWLKYIAYPLKS